MFKFILTYFIVSWIVSVGAVLLKVFTSKVFKAIQFLPDSERMRHCYDVAWDEVVGTFLFGISLPLVRMFILVCAPLIVAIDIITRFDKVCRRTLELYYEGL